MGKQSQQESPSRGLCAHFSWVRATGFPPHVGDQRGGLPCFCPIKLGVWGSGSPGSGFLFDIKEAWFGVIACTQPEVGKGPGSLPGTLPETHIPRSCPASPPLRCPTLPSFSPLPFLSTPLLRFPLSLSHKSIFSFCLPKRKTE